MMSILRYQSSSLLGLNCINNWKLLLRFVCDSKTLKGVIFLAQHKEIVRGEDRYTCERERENVCV